MNLEEVYFGFHAPSLDPITSLLGHVEVWGYTADETWVFINPEHDRLKVAALHRYDDVTDAVARRFHHCRSILRLAPGDRALRVPLFPPMTCAGVCGHLVGVRAFTPWGLRAQLLRIGAEIVHEKPQGAEGRPGGEGRARA